MNLSCKLFKEFELKHFHGQLGGMLLELWAYAVVLIFKVFIED